MATTADFKNGLYFSFNGKPCSIVWFQHVKPGKGAAFIRTKYKNIITGATREEAFNPSDKFENAMIETKQIQYLYNNGELYYFTGACWRRPQDWRPWDWEYRKCCPHGPEP